MPEKSVREMSARERLRHSLAARVFHASAMHSAVLGLLCLVIGLGMYLNAVMQESMKGAYDAAHESLLAVAAEVDPGAYAGQTLEIFREARDAGLDGDAYYASFDAIGADAGYQRMLEILCAKRTEGMSDFFFAVTDEASGSLVFVADTDPRPGHAYPIGRQIRVPGWFQRFFFSRGNGSFPRTYYYLPTRGLLCVSGAYIREGDPTGGFLFVMIKANEALSGVRSFVFRYVLAILAAIVVMGYQLTRRMKKTLVQPINAIAGAARSYVEDRRAGRDAEHFAHLNIRTGDEVENLSLVMADMERSLADYEEDLTRIAAEKERINTELSLATRIQSAMLPHVFPPFPDRPEFDLYATMEPAKEVGGDFYDYFLIDDDHLGMVMADVSGKGVPAALFMMASKIMLGNNAMMGRSPAQGLEATNNAICSNNQAGMFVTVWFGILEISTGKVTAANAGHEYPALKEAGGRFEVLKDRHDFVIGGMSGVKYKEYAFRLDPGAKLFVYTDGVPEATNAANEMFGMERMVAALNRDPEAAPKVVIGNVRRAVDEFVADAPQFDDLTMMCIEYDGDRGRNEKP